MSSDVSNGTMVGGKQKFLRNVIIILISNIFSMISGVLVGFIIPQIMGVSEYGYYKTFTLYCSYIGILHFGFIDGIYLKFAGKKYEELDKEKFRAYTKFLFMMESTITCVVMLIALFFLNTNYFLVVLFVGLNILATNVITYFEFISQITMKFKRMMLRNVIRCSLNILFVALLYYLYIFNEVRIYNYYYVIITLAINYVLAIWYVISYRDIAFGKSSQFREIKSELRFFFKIGILLLGSNLISQLIYVVDQQFVNIAFDNDTYSVYAFAYNMINLITIATSAISTVLYPTLSNIDEDSIKANYSVINSYLLVFVAFCLIVYYPLVFIVNYFLPSYKEALNIFCIILPGVLISSSIGVIKYNIYKKFNKIKRYFIVSLIMLGSAILSDFIVYILFRNTISISIVSIVVLFIWYILVEMYFIQQYKIKWLKNVVYILTILSGFYFISLLFNIYVGMVCYLAFYLLVTVAFNYKEVKLIINKINNRKNRKVSGKNNEENNI